MAWQMTRLFESGSRGQEVEIGAVFQTIRPGNIIETAKVLDITPDSLGVPHVHYAVSIENANRRQIEDERTLGLTSFAERFHRVVPA